MPPAIAETITVGDLMHPTLVRHPFDRPGWVFEHKLDGFRAFVRKVGGQVELLSRQGNSLAIAFPEIARALAGLPNGVVLDAELVVPDERTLPSFERLRTRAVMKREISIADAAVLQPAALCVFNVLVLKGKDIRARPLLERKGAIAPIIEGLPGVHAVSHLSEHGLAVFAAAVELGRE